MSREKSILGVHIDDNFLNIVYLSRTANGLKVCGSAIEPLEDGVVKDGVVVSEGVVAQKIRAFFKANKLRAPKVVMSPSCTAVTLKPSEFSAQSDEQMQKQVQEQVEKYTLFGNEEIVFDYCTIEEDGRVSDRQTVLEAITTRRMSDVCFAVARKARLDLVRIEPAILPIIKLVYDRILEESVRVSLLLALDAKSGNISVFEEAMPRLCQNLNIGIKDISENEDSIDYLTDQMKPVLEFSRSLVASASKGIVLKVAASCPNDQLCEIVAKIQRKFSGVIIEQIVPAKLNELFNVKNTSREELPVFAFALALTALGVSKFTGQLNLVSQKSLAIEKTRCQLSLTAKTMVAIFLLAVAARYPFQMKIRTLEATSAKVEAKNAGVMPIKQKIASVTQQIKELREKQAAYAQAIEKLAGIPWPQVLLVIADTVPDKVRIVGISTAGQGNFMLTGETWVESEVRRFAEELQNTELIQSAKVGTIKYDDSDTHVTVKYEITCKVPLQNEKL